MIAPMSQIDGVLLLAISSPSVEENNWFSDLIKAKDEHGRSLLFSTKFKNICDKCKVKNPRYWGACTHVPDKLPDFKSEAQRTKFDQAYAIAGLADRNMAENYGCIMNYDSKFFTNGEYDYMFKTDYFSSVDDTTINWDSSYSHVIMSIDPNNGGNDQTAITTSIINMKTRQIFVCTFIYTISIAFGFIHIHM